MKKYFLYFGTITFAFYASSQSFTSYFIGNTNDAITNPQGGVCLVGGATEDDEAMKWFLNRASGGDILVLRASGSDGYNNYFYSELGVSVNSVETIRFNNAQASTDPYVLNKIKKAEAIWFAGGDQWNYVSYWRNTPIDSLINKAIWEKNIVVGGTSAGMAILGSHYFTAQNGTITSIAALQNPFDNNLMIDNAPFLKAPHLNNVITDTHYENPDRKGRHSVFIARFLFDYGTQVRGIACDEYTAVCIEPNGIARVFGGFPTYDDNAYFIQINCELANFNPETIAPNQPITWDRGNEALKVYAVKGTNSGLNTFDLNDWSTGSGGEWQHWYVTNGVINQNSGTSVNCVHASIENSEESQVVVFPNPFLDHIEIQVNKIDEYQIKVLTLDGKIVQDENLIFDDEQLKINATSLESGVYIILLTDKSGKTTLKKISKI